MEKKMTRIESGQPFTLLYGSRKRITEKKGTKWRVREGKRENLIFFLENIRTLFTFCWVLRILFILLFMFHESSVIGNNDDKENILKKHNEKSRKRVDGAKRGRER